jgi:hypothetical protein
MRRKGQTARHLRIARVFVNALPTLCQAMNSRSEMNNSLRSIEKVLQTIHRGQILRHGYPESGRTLGNCEGTPRKRVHAAARSQQSGTGLLSYKSTSSGHDDVHTGNRIQCMIDPAAADRRPLCHTIYSNELAIQLEMALHHLLHAKFTLRPNAGCGA